MIISVNWLKKFIDIDSSIDELATLIGERLVEIESVVALADKYKDVIIVKVMTCRPVEDSDHLRVVEIDDGGVVEGVERNEAGLIQVVCGAPNVYEGMLAAWLPPTSIVPETFNDDEPFTLGARALRGYMSNGMLTSAKELDLFDDHEGIIEVDLPVAPGTRFAEAYELDDYLLDIENKSLTHRPDAFGIVGFAREVAGIQGKQFTTPDWLTDIDAPIIPEGELVEAPHIIIEDQALSERFAAIVLSGANESARSPLLMRTYLSRSGVRPISSIVDVTNYVMLLTGQPLHAYDYDKLLKVSGGVNEIRVRSARSGETLKIIDGRTLELSEADIVIAAGDTAVGLAGAMGGYDTEIDNTTQRILLEGATFDLYSLRSVQMRHGIFSEAITRLTKGIPAPLSGPVLRQAAGLLGEYANARVATPLTEDYPRTFEPLRITITTAMINKTLGAQLSTDDIAQTLTHVEFGIEVHGDELVVTVPYWRHDMVIAEDVIEEVGRLRGFDSIAVTLPRRDFTAVMPDSFDRFRSRLRQLLVRAGANEVLTYSFVHGDVMRKAHQQPAEAYRIVNSLSPELQYYRQSLTPSLLQAVHPNVKSGYDHFAVFELNKFHTKRHELTDEAVPKELDSLAFVLARHKPIKGAPFYEAKYFLSYIASAIGVDLVYEPLETEGDYPVTQPFEPRRSARIWNHDKTIRVGVIGEYRRSVAQSFKLPEYTAGFEISPRALHDLARQAPSSYAPQSRFPSVERDISIQVDPTTTYQAVFDAIHASIDEVPLQVTVSPLTMYQPESQAAKTITVRLTYTALDRTLTGAEAQDYTKTITNHVTAVTGGTVI